MWKSLTLLSSPQAVRVLTIVNSGKFNFDYQLQPSTSSSPMLSISGPKFHGTIRHGERLSFRLEFHPIKDTSLDGGSMRVVIAGKYEYEARFAGVGVRPPVAFSFMDHDFGPCFVSVPGLAPVAERTTLRLSNNDATATFSVDCAFAKTRMLDVLMAPTMLEPGRNLDVGLVFTPRAVQDYDILVPFVINGSIVVNVRVRGQGINPRLELADPTKALIAFGQINEGAQLSKQVRPMHALLLRPHALAL